MLLSLAAKPLPLTVTDVPTVPLVLVIVIVGVTVLVKLAEAVMAALFPSVAAIGYVPEAIAGTLKVTLKLPPVSGLAVVCNKPLKLTLTLDGYA
jgi:hypothetical protein